MKKTEREPKPLNWYKLEEDFREERSVVLFLGAGIDYEGPNNKDYSWDGLLNHLLGYAVKQMVPSGEGTHVAEDLMSSASKKMEEISPMKDNIGPEYVSSIMEQIKNQNQQIGRLREQLEIDTKFKRDVKSTIIKQTLGNDKYVKLIQDFLYGKMDKEELEKAGDDYSKYVKGVRVFEESEKIDFFSLFSVADFILRNKNIRAVVTQNYDHFLCEAIKILQRNDEYRKTVNECKKTTKCKCKDCERKDRCKKKGKVRNIIPNVICDWKGHSDFTYNHFNIYHVHGFIPRYDDIQVPKGNRIVLSLDEFYEDSQNVYSWQIASQLHFLSQYTCIFCGLSLDDYTNQRLLHYVKGKHHGNLYYLTASLATKNDDELMKKRKEIMDIVMNTYHENNGLTVLYDKKGFKHIYSLLGTLNAKKRINQKKQE